MIEAADASRVTPRYPKGRPIQIAIWYPAASLGPALTYRDYLFLAATETASSGPGGTAAKDPVAEYRSLLVSAGSTAEQVEAFLGTRTRASRGVPAAPGRCPLVLIAQGSGQSAHDQAFLAELLAERGYVVATTPSQTRIGDAMTGEEEIPAQVEAQAADLAFALHTIRAEATGRLGAYGIVGDSFGARSALLLAMRDPEVAALVSLDGGIGGKAGKGWLEKANGFDLADATAPILHIYEEGDRFMVPDLDLLHALDRADRWLVRVDAMRHVHFSSIGVAVRSIPKLAQATSADSRTGAAWEAVADAAGSFLDRFLAAPVAGDSKGWTPPASPLFHCVLLPAKR